MINFVALDFLRDIFRDMSNGNEIERSLVEAAEKIRREGYVAGWRDAMAAVAKAAAELAPPESLPDASPQFSGGSNTAQNVSGIKMGSTPWYVLQAVRKRPGMTGSEVVDTVISGGHKVSDALIRTALSRLGEKKLIVGRHRKWFPA